MPSLVRELEVRWSVTVDAPFVTPSKTAWVAPALGASGQRLVLKLGRAHDEAVHEADGLRAWDGEGAVRLHARAEFAGVTAMLIERCVPGTPLATRPQREQDGVVGPLLRRLWREPPPAAPFRPLQQMCDAWADEFEAHWDAGRSAVDAGLAREGIALFRELPSTAQRSVLLVTDLHAGNVLAAEREPWLIIDPKPYAGDPAYDVLQHMLNCRERLHAGARDFASHMSDLTGVDPTRVLLWLFARCVQESPASPDLGEVARRIAP